MVDPHLLSLFVAAVVVLALTPGPNLALIIANSVAYGPSYGLLTVAGTTSAMVVQLALTALGMTELLGSLGTGFEAVRWAGVAYLLYIGVAQWRAPPTDLSAVRPEPKSRRLIYGRALLVSLTNPKTLFFYGAFFPQFVDRTHDVGAQAALLSAVFLAVVLLLDCTWAVLAARLRGVLARHGRLRNRISGGLLMGAGVGLAAVRTR